MLIAVIAICILINIWAMVISIRTRVLYNGPLWTILLNGGLAVFNVVNLITVIWNS